MREKLITLFVVSLFFTVLFVGASSFTGTVVDEVHQQLSDEFRDAKNQEVYSCKDRSTLGAGEVSIVVNKGHLRTVYMSDLCVTKRTLRLFACTFDQKDKKHFLISTDVKCPPDSECKHGQCVESHVWDE